MENSPLILLAGGKSSRMGTPKGLLKVGDKYWLEEQIDQFKKSGGSRVIVVLGYDVDPYQNLFQNRYSFAINPHPENGPFSSIQIGLKSAGDFSSAFILPIDVPCAEKKVFDSLFDEIRNAKACIPTYEGKGGHPVLVSRKFANEIQTFPPQDRLDHHLKSLTDGELKRVPVLDGRILKNFNFLGEFKDFHDA